QAGRWLVARLERDLVRPGQELDRPVGVPEREVEAAEVVQQAADVRAVLELLVVAARPFGIGPGEKPVPLALGDERRLEVRPGRGLAVARGLGELERALHVLAGRLPVALAAVAPGAPVEDLAAEPVAGQPGAIRELERRPEQRDRGRD